jgi:hypothetical protein
VVSPLPLALGSNPVWTKVLFGAYYLYITAITGSHRSISYTQSTWMGDSRTMSARATEEPK